MAKIIFKEGTKEELKNEPLRQGLLSFTTDDGKIHLDYKNEEDQIIRKTFYGGKLTIGNKVFDGTEDVNIDIYDGSIDE